MATLPKQFRTESGSAVTWGGPGLSVSWEENPELIFPHSIKVFDQMRKTDGQIASVLRAINLSILGTGWKLLGSDVDPEVIKFVQSDLGLQADQVGRTRKPESGFSWTEFLRQSLTFGPLGFSLFERLYAVGADNRVHLKNLSFRPQRSINELIVNSDGSLSGAKQWIRDNQEKFFQYREVVIPAEQLVVFCADREGGDWYGQSWLRPCWFNWNTKVKMMISDAIAVDRSGGGIPVYKFQGAGSSTTQAQALDISTRLRSGDSSGVAIPAEDSIEVLWGNKDALASIKFHNEEIGRSLLAMILNLGHDRGSQSLGDTQYELFCASMNAVTDYVAEVITESVIRPLVEFNWGTGVPYPVLVADPITPEVALTPEQLVALSNANIMTIDEELEADVRRRYGYPPVSRGVQERPVEETPVVIRDVDELSSSQMAAQMAASKGEGLAELQARVDLLRSRIETRKNLR